MVKVGDKVIYYIDIGLNLTLYKVYQVTNIIHSYVNDCTLYTIVNDSGSLEYYHPIFFYAIIRIS